MTNSIQKNKTLPGYGLENVVDNIFNHTLRRFFDGNLWDTGNARNTGTVPVNVRETEQQYELDVIAPGCRKEDFSIQVQAGELQISFQQQDEMREKQEKAGWVRNEYILRSFSRSFSLDHTIDTGKISAHYLDGILRVILPKNELAKPRAIAVDVQ